MADKKKRRRQGACLQEQVTKRNAESRASAPPEMMIVRLLTVRGAAGSRMIPAKSCSYYDDPSLNILIIMLPAASNPYIYSVGYTLSGGDCRLDWTGWTIRPQTECDLSEDGRRSRIRSTE